MTKSPLATLLLRSLLITAAGFAFFTLFANRLPHPEDFSPFVYVVAFLLCLQVWWRLPAKQKWLYAPIVLLCLLALLDESGYGSEVMEIQPFYSTRYNTEVRDLHNAFGLGQELLAIWLRDNHWQAASFVRFLRLDGLLALGAFLFAWALRQAQGDRQAQAVRWVAWAWLAVGLAAAAWLLALPADARNAVVGGYSATRLLTVAAILALSALPLWLHRAHGPRLQAALARGLAAGRGRAATWLAAALVLAGLAYQLQASFLFLPDDLVRLERILPIVAWLLAVASLAWVGLMVWRGHFRRGVRAWLGDALAWLRDEPAFFHAGFAVALILVAQLIDREFIPLNQWIQPTEHIPLWGLWTEEVFEMLAAVFFFLAGRSFKPSNTAPKDS